MGPCRRGNGKRHGPVAEKRKYSLAAEIRIAGQLFIRIGYDSLLRCAIYFLRSTSSVRARPIHRIHITILRDILVGASNTFEEVPPVPAGYNFIVCLTHE